jgi:hypothetical protein
MGCVTPIRSRLKWIYTVGSFVVLTSWAEDGRFRGQLVFAEKNSAVLV